MMLPKKAYFVGIVGIGMSALAQYLADHGVSVSGSDRDASPVTELLESKGISVVIGQQAENVPKDAEVLIYSEAVPKDNTERAQAREYGIPEFSYFEMLGNVSAGKKTIAITGTHGKTTTTSMTARILIDAGLSPSVVVGSIVKDFGSNYVHGDSELFVVEACEYKRDFRFLSPTILVVTNIEWDHTDYYANLAEVQAAFREMIEKVPEDGAIVTDVEHPNIAPLLEGVRANVIDYKKEPEREIRLPGAFNEDNARAAAAAARAAAPALSEETIAASLGRFQGTWRRFEEKGKTERGVTVYDDYAHHPTAIAKTLAALRAQTRGKILVAFHPHLYSRTRDLLPQFITAFKDADEVVIAPIYAAREVDDGTISNHILAEKICKTGTRAQALDSFAVIEQHLLGWGGEGDVIITMGAGDIYKVADAIVM